MILKSSSLKCVCTKLLQRSCTRHVLSSNYGSVSHVTRVVPSTDYSICCKHVTFRINPIYRHYCSSFHSEMAAEISYKPNGHLLVDDNLEITVKGLGSHQKVTVYAHLDEDGKMFESCGCFQADDYGMLNLKKHVSLSGTYKGVSSMGLFWSMEPCPGQKEGIRLMKKDMDTPFISSVYVYDGHCSLNDLRERTPQEICTTVIERWYKHPGVTSYDVTDGNIRGRLFMPPGDGPFPGVIDMFGTVGGITEYRAALLASRGLASLALPYFLYQDLPDHIYGLSLDYFLEAVDWMLSRKNIISGGIGVVGASKGGDIALIMGQHSPQSKVRAIVNINGCAFNASAPMTYSGGDIPEVPWLPEHMEVIDGNKHTMHKSLQYEPSVITRVWENDAKVLNIVSGDDLCCPSGSIEMMKEMYPAEKTDNCIVVSYPEAGHLVEPPYTPLCSMSYHKAFGAYFLWGGYPEPHAFAQEDSWKRILKFLHEELSLPVVAAKL